MDLFVESTAIALHRNFVGGDVGGKLVAAGAIGARHEVERIALGGGERGADGSESGIGDGARRQALVAVGVIGMVAIQVAAIDDAAVIPLKQGGVDGGGVAIQLHADRSEEHTSELQS